MTLFHKLLLTRPPPLDSCLFPFPSTLSGRSMRKPHQLILPEAQTVNYRYNVTDGTLKKLRYIRFYVIPVYCNFCKNTQNCVISIYRYNVMLVKTQNYVISVYRFNVMLVKTQNYLISVYRCNMLVKTQNYVISVLINASLFRKT